MSLNTDSTGTRNTGTKIRNLFLGDLLGTGFFLT